ncbi:unnamed protein product [Pieris macdunnoughi]|uniref:Defensin n=1 Tax=Pieris macdunnoughi TaxID=345717 RepID=A0A821USD2_9NEOP|nr:unnamed protein product [Pieris macdunnoughi]
MKVLAIALIAALVCITQASPIGEEVEVPELAADAMQPMELLNGARQRICTPVMCQNLCRSLGWRYGSCNAQRFCVCRRKNS